MLEIDEKKGSDRSRADRSFEDLCEEAEDLIARHTQRSTARASGPKSDPLKPVAEAAGSKDTDSEQGPVSNTDVDCPGTAEAPLHEPNEGDKISLEPALEDRSGATLHVAADVVTKPSIPAPMGETHTPPVEAARGAPRSSAREFTESFEALMDALKNARAAVPDVDDDESPSRSTLSASQPLSETEANAATVPVGAEELEPFTSPLESVPVPKVSAARQSQVREGPAQAQPKGAPPESAKPTVAFADPEEALAELRSALESVRDAVSELEPEETAPKKRVPTPYPRKTTDTSSDGIPKSVSEHLPKYKATPRKRICGRCGNETRLRSERCQTCNFVDDSLGVLDAVIAGDLRKVEQILLVKPHVIGTRTSRHEWTLLHMASSGGNARMVELLILKGASINAVNVAGKTALHYATGKGHTTIVSILLRNLADATLKYCGKTALDLAIEKGHESAAALLRNA